ncbi:Fic/DOC family protein [Microlunatus sp. Y2014]|uniref:Fic/DOC family protein n=1 Tax=Microlunatus sp. Y2014 TaxID=3418488 RepID=UPI003DA7706F
MSQRWDAYFWPGTQVLRNRLGIHDATELRRAEYAIASAREVTLRLESAEFTTDHLRDLHRELFGDIYDWAGQYRDVGISKDGSTFAPPDQIAEHAEQAIKIAVSTQWEELDLDGFAQQAGQMYTWLNLAHPFREGNGRTHRVMLAQTAQLSRFRLNLPSTAELARRTAASMPAAGRAAPDPAPVATYIRAHTLVNVDVPPPAAHSELTQLCAALKHATDLADRLADRPGLTPSDRPEPDRSLLDEHTLPAHDRGLDRTTDDWA